MIKKFIASVFLVSFILSLCSCAPVTIETAPAGAAVYSADGQTQLGTTPFNTSVFVAEKNFLVHKDRYFNQAVNLNYDSPRTVRLNLRTIPVVVHSTPPAEIYAAGAENALGSTPMQIAVYEQERTYTVKAKDYYDKEITVGLSSPDPLFVELARRPIVTISASPAGVEVYENGTLIGTAPVREEILTSRTFELRKPGYFTKALTLKGAPPYETSVELKPFPVITVAAAPAGAQIYRAGSLIGKDSVKLAVGEKIVLDVRADRFYPQNVTLTPESPEQINVQLKAMPYVMIRSEPAGAEIFIEGKSAGTAPVEQLIEKDTVIEVRKEGFITKTATLTGADKQVTVVLDAVPPPAASDVLTNAAAGAKSSAQTPDGTVSSASGAADSQDPAPEKSNRLLWIIVAAVAVAAGLAVFLIKRKKQ